MKRNVPPELLAALHAALDKNRDVMLRYAADQSQHNCRAYLKSSRKVTKLFETALNVPYRETVNAGQS